MATEATTDDQLEVAAPRTRRSGKWRVTSGLLATPLVWLIVFFVIPVVLVGLYSVGALTLLRNDVYLSLEKWRFFFTSDTYVSLFWKSVRMSLGVSITSVLLAYPIAYLLALIAGRRKYTLLLVIIVPFLTSYLLRVLAWRVILGEQGVVNSFLQTVGLVDQPVEWLFYSQFAIYAVLAYVWVPFVALPIFVSLDGLDRRLLEAASDLGASRWQAFWRVTLPLSMPGVVAAFLFVFIPTVGEFVTPSLVGGTSGYMYGNAIADQFNMSLDWQTGSVLALFLLGVVTLLTLLFARFLQVRQVATG